MWTKMFCSLPKSSKTCQVDFAPAPAPRALSLKWEENSSSGQLVASAFEGLLAFARQTSCRLHLTRSRRVHSCLHCRLLCREVLLLSICFNLSNSCVMGLVGHSSLTTLLRCINLKRCWHAHLDTCTSMWIFFATVLTHWGWQREPANP